LATATGAGGASLDLPAVLKVDTMNDSRRLHAKLLDHIPAAVVVSDGQGRIVYCNHEARQLYGCAEGGAVPSELVELAQHAERWEGELKVAGHRVHCRASPVQGSTGQRVGTMTVSLPRHGSRADTLGKDLTEVGRRIAVARNAAGLTQEELANRLGVTRRSVQGYEAGSVAPFRHLDVLSQVLGRSSAWFLLEGPAASDEALQEALRQHRLTLERDLRRIVREEVAAIR
jgi:transcriptional regulator with XRE-family HTH domain